MAAKRKYKKRTKKTSNIDFTIIFTVLISVVVAALVYTRSGVVGETLSDVLGGMVGWLKYILPIGSLVVAIRTASDKTQDISVKLLQYIFFIICIAVVSCCIECSNGSLNVNENLQVTMQNAYDLGVNNSGGGALGALASVPLVKLFGKVVSIIIGIILSIIMFAITFGINLSEKLGESLERYTEKKEEIQEERLKRRELMKEEESEREKRRRIYCGSRLLL